MIEDGDMPPDDEPQPKVKDRQAVTEWIDQAIKDARKPSSEKKEIPRNPQASPFYDALVVSASQKRWFDTSQLSRRKAGSMLHDALIEKHGDVADIEHQFVLSCPTLEELQPVLDASLMKEKYIWGIDIAKEWKEAHIHEFHEHIRNYCWIDTEATLQNMRSFFLHDYVSLVERKKKKHS